MTAFTDFLARPLGRCISVLIYAGSLYISYRYLIAPHWEYLGFGYAPTAPIFYIIALPAVSVCTAATPSNVAARPTALIVWALLTVVLAPALLVPIWAGLPDSLPTYGRYAFLMSVGYLILASTLRLRPIRVPLHGLSPQAFYWQLLVVFFLLHAMLIYIFGPEFRLVNPLDVQPLRESFRSAQSGASLGRISGYILTWSANIVNPVLLLIGLTYRRRGLVILSVAAQVYLFSVTGYKLVMFSFPVIVAVYFAYVRWSWQYMLSLLPIALVGTIVTLGTLDVVTGSYTFTSVGVRRLIVAPGLLSWHYLDFFAQNSQSFLSQSILGSLFINPYPDGIPRTIGRAVFDQETNANVNMLADAYANFGGPGVLVYALAAGMFLLLLDSLLVDRPGWLAVGLVSMPAFTLTNTALHTAITTHGLAVALVIAALAPPTASLDNGLARRSRQMRFNQNSTSSGRRHPASWT